MKPRQFALFAAALSLLVWAASPASGGKTSSTLQSATSTISDSFPMSGGGTGTYNVQSDGVGAYLNGQDGVSSGVNVNWVLDLTQSSRTAGVQLNNGVGGITPPAGVQSSGQLKLQVDCFRVNRDMLTMQQGQVSSCPALIRLPLITKLSYYQLDMAESGSETETTQVQVQCNSVAVGQCNDWYVDPIGTLFNSDGSISPGQAIARLNYITQKGTANEGDFYLTFHYHVTRP